MLQQVLSDGVVPTIHNLPLLLVLLPKISIFVGNAASNKQPHVPQN